MKATELMIGDWYEWHPDAIPHDKHYEKVTITTLQILLKSKKHCDCCNPIPLTPEILEKNGFEYVEQEETCATESYHIWSLKNKCFHLEDDSWYLKPENRTFRVRFGIAKITYIHDLQHALRLCGLNDMADNFKVE